MVTGFPQILWAYGHNNLYRGLSNGIVVGIRVVFGRPENGTSSSLAASEFLQNGHWMSKMHSIPSIEAELKAYRHTGFLGYLPMCAVKGREERVRSIRV